MSAEIETTEAPNWLSELEKKREIRLKARLGHEAGAGAPCIQCSDKCPGLDLHFWRKICKNCKCSKEDHDVHDDDIYGWAQFQLLGSKPNRIKKKIVLPGKKDEVELEWTPKGNTETIDRYLKTLAPESLPVKGSQAAQARKQLLQKQIPIHDIDPTLCHDLTDSELAKMQDYIKHMKSSAGVGQIIQLGGLHYASSIHSMGETNPQYIASRYHKGGFSIEAVDLLDENKAAGLSRQLEQLGVQDQKELDAFFDKIPKPQNMAAYSDKLPYNFQQHLASTTFVPDSSLVGSQNYSKPFLPNSSPHYLNNIPKPESLNWATHPNYSEVNQNLADVTSSSSNVAYNAVDENPIGGTLTADHEINRNMPHYASSALNIKADQQFPSKIGNIRDLAFSTYNPSTDVANSNYKQLPSYVPSQVSQSENQIFPDKVNVGVIRDVVYDNPEIRTAVQGENQIFQDYEVGRKIAEDEEGLQNKQCKRCTKHFKPEEFAILVEKSSALYHSTCFKCAGCNQDLADLFYFYDKELDDVYCGRDFAKIRGIPRCKACDELIFVKEYCLAENSTFHLKHFCCFECDEALAGQNYVVEDSQPLCLPCFEKVKANKCFGCSKVIKPDEEGVALAANIHFHTAQECFCCSVCRKPLKGAKLMFKHEKLYCSPDCFRVGH